MKKIILYITFLGVLALPFKISAQLENPGNDPDHPPVPSNLPPPGGDPDAVSINIYVCVLFVLAIIYAFCLLIKIIKNKIET